MQFEIFCKHILRTAHGLNEFILPFNQHKL